MNKLSLAAYYEADAQKEHHLWGAARVRVEIVCDLIGTGKKILDVGASDGTIAQAFKEQGNTVTAIDISKAAVKKLIQKGIEAYQVDVEQEELPKGPFDIVFAGELIEHLFDPIGFLNSCRRVLKNKGRVILTTPNLASLGRRVLLLLGKNPHIDPWVEEGGVGGHIRYYVPQTLRELLTRGGFSAELITSDIVKFDRAGRVYSQILARLLPSFGWELIAVGRKDVIR